MTWQLVKFLKRDLKDAIRTGEDFCNVRTDGAY